MTQTPVQVSNRSTARRLTTAQAVAQNAGECTNTGHISISFSIFHFYKHEYFFINLLFINLNNI